MDLEQDIAKLLASLENPFLRPKLVRRTSEEEERLLNAATIINNWICQGYVIQTLHLDKGFLVKNN